MRLRDERGQAMVLSVLFLAGLLGAVALVLDVGSWYREQRDTQAAADAAALAAAHALPESTSSASNLAAEYAGKNGGGTTTVEFQTALMTNDTVRVSVTRQAPAVFARLLNIDSVGVGAHAAARVGLLEKARYAAPIGVDVTHPLLQCKPVPCFGQQTTLDLGKVGPGGFRLINLDNSKGGTGPSILADWIERGYEGEMGLGWYYSDPGAKFNSSHVKGAMANRLGDELLFPLYKTIRGNGANLQYDIVGWVGFLMTDFDAHGSTGSIAGQFVRVIWEGIPAMAAGGSYYGVRAVSLIE
jgi:Flp pilus assembly protein TadG